MDAINLSARIVEKLRSYLSKFADVANTFTFQSTEVGSDAALFKVNDTSERLVEK